MSKPPTFARVAQVALVVLCVACGSDNPAGVDESAAPTRNDLFSYRPGPAGAAPGYRVEVDLDGEVLGSESVEVGLLTERDYRRATATHVSASSASLVGTRRRATALTERVERSSGAQVSFGTAAAPDPTSRTFASVLARATPTVAPSRRMKAIGDDSVRDRDGDGVSEDAALPVCTGGQVTGCSDNCPYVENPDQQDEDLDRIGDACADDPDGDGVNSDGDGSGSSTDNPCTSATMDACDDNCPAARNERQWDADGDGVGDACDPDANGNGTADLDEGALDHDGDGVPTSEEGQGDADGDGSPDYLDADDDGDGIPSRLEDDGDAQRDTDNDGQPDRVDEDADGDGVPDAAEGLRDTDGDGRPNAQDTDDDGDGVPTATETAEGNTDSDGDGVPDYLDDDDSDGCPARAVGELYRDIPTFDGWTQWASWTGSVNLGFQPCANDASRSCNVQDYTWAYHLAPDGQYFSLQYAEGIAFTLDIAAAGSTQSVGFMRSPESDPSRISATTMSSGRNLSFSWEPAPFTSMGFTTLERIDPGTSGPGLPSLAKFFQFDVGVGISIGPGFFGFGILPDFVPALTITDGGITIMQGTGLAREPAFLMVAGVAGACPEALGGARSRDTRARQRGREEKAAAPPPLLAMASTVRRGATSTPSSARDVGRRDAWAAMLPLAAMLEERVGTGSAQFIAAPTAADWLGEYVESESDASCRNCANASLDGISARISDAVAGGDGTVGDLASAASEEAALMQALWPEREAMTSLVALAAAGSINAITQLAYDVAAVRRGDPFRFVSTDTVEVAAIVGEPAAFSVTAAEISALVGYPVQDIEGATVCVENNPQIDRVCGRIESGELAGTVTPSGLEDYVLGVEVDLRTAAGRFDDFAVQDWVIRPATRIFRVSPGPVDAVVLRAPAEMVSGGVATFTATLVDASGLLVRRPAQYRLYGYDGAVIASASSMNGTAVFQLQPEPVRPSVTRVEVRDVEVGGESVPGYVVFGQGLSRDADFLFDGRSATERGYLQTVADAGSAGIAVVGAATTLAPGTHRLVVVNPGDMRAEVVSFEVP